MNTSAYGSGGQNETEILRARLSDACFLVKNEDNDLLLCLDA